MFIYLSLSGGKSKMSEDEYEDDEDLEDLDDSDDD